MVEKKTPGGLARYDFLIRILSNYGLAVFLVIYYVLVLDPSHKGDIKDLQNGMNAVVEKIDIAARVLNESRLGQSFLGSSVETELRRQWERLSGSLSGTVERLNDVELRMSRDIGRVLQEIHSDNRRLMDMCVDILMVVQRAVPRSPERWRNVGRGDDEAREMPTGTDAERLKNRIHKGVYNSLIDALSRGSFRSAQLADAIRMYVCDEFQKHNLDLRSKAVGLPNDGVDSQFFKSCQDLAGAIMKNRELMDIVGSGEPAEIIQRKLRARDNFYKHFKLYIVEDAWRLCFGLRERNVAERGGPVERK